MQRIFNERKVKRDDLFPSHCLAKINLYSGPETIKRCLQICSSVYPVDKEKVLKNTAQLVKQVNIAVN